MTDLLISYHGVFTLFFSFLLTMLFQHGFLILWPRFTRSQLTQSDGADDVECDVKRQDSDQDKQDGVQS
jgi:hypothetical protein